MKAPLLTMAAVGLAAAGYLAGFASAPSPSSARPAEPIEKTAQYLDLEARLAQAVEERDTLARRVADLERALADEAREDPSSDRDRALGALRELASREQAEEVVRALSRAFVAGDLGELDLLNFLAEPGRETLIAAGMNDRDLPDRLRSVLLESILNVKDPLSVIRRIDTRTEPNEEFWAYMNRIVIAEVDRGNDDRAVDVIEDLLAGSVPWALNHSQLTGESKFNLLASLAQMAGRGDARAASHVRDRLGTAAPSIMDSGYDRGLRVLARPPARGEDGEPLRGALIMSVKVRGRHLKVGMIVIRIGDDLVTDRRTFHAALDRWKPRSREKHIEVRVLIPDPDDPSRYRAETRKLDPADFRLRYGVYSIGG